MDIRALGSSEEPIAAAFAKIEMELSSIRVATDQTREFVKALTFAIERGIYQEFFERKALNTENALANLMSKFSPAETLSYWTDEKVELLKKLWAEGLSASQIAGKLGNISRNAVLGKAHRLGLASGGLGLDRDQ